MSISFEGIGQWCATFACSNVSEGTVVKMSANDTVAACAAGEGFCGVVAAVGRDGAACSVQLGGFVKLPYSGESAPSVGMNVLAADGSGGVAVAESGEKYLAVCIDSAEKTVTIKL